MLQKLQSRRNILAISAALLVLLGTAAALAPRRTRADGGSPIRATFSVTYAGIPNTAGASFCGGAPMALNVESHGAGSSNFGPLSFSLHKTVDLATGAAHGCIQLTAPNGDTLDSIGDLKLGTGNDHQFAPGTDGTLTFTGGTGRFQGASGTAVLGAVFANFYPASSFIGGTSYPVQGAAVYTVDGTVFLPAEDH